MAWPLHRRGRARVWRGWFAPATHARMKAQMQTQTSTRTQSHTHARTHAHTHARTQIHTLLPAPPTHECKGARAHKTHRHTRTHARTDRQTDRQTDTHTHTHSLTLTHKKNTSARVRRRSLTEVRRAEGTVLVPRGHCAALSPELRTLRSSSSILCWSRWRPCHSYGTCRAWRCLRM